MAETPMLALFGAYAALAAGAAVQDALTFRISNWFFAGLVAVGAAAIAVEFDARWWQYLASSLIVLACGMSLFAVRWIGAEDAKLFAACALAFPLASLAKMAAFVMMVGGAMALLVIAAQLLGRNGRKLRREIPYGIAIAAGTFTTIFLDPSASLFF